LELVLDITWLGYSAMRLRTRNAAIVIDPTDKSSGVDMARPTGDIVLISRDHIHHNFVNGVKGTPFVVSGPGEYEVGGVQIQGIRSRWVTSQEDLPEPTTLYILQAEDMKVVYLGGLNENPDPRQIQVCSNADILIVPIALTDGLNPQDSARIARSLEPKIVIPVGYPDEQKKKDDALLSFIGEMGVDVEEAVQRLNLQRRSIGDKNRIALLHSRG
tara:strand:- start:1931 stop:2578 length:648 start_codon:yes stop_codon:yes gene_type:complete